MLFQTKGAYTSFERIKVIYKNVVLSKEENVYIMNESVLTALVPEGVTSQYDDENAVFYLT
jgi:hypothetical protein